MIRLEHISKKIGENIILDDVSLDISKSETFVLLGASGSGKTTTLKTINGLIPQTSGTVYFNDKKTADIRPENLRREMGYVLQNTGLFPHYTIYQNISIVPNLLKWDKQKIKERAVELFKKLHLREDYFDRYPAELSGGQQQRIGLGRALMADPPVLLMDEPFGALDPVIRHSISQEFSKLDEWKSKTIVLVTHDVEEAFLLADRIALMDKGKIIQVGKPADFLLKPANDTVRNFFAAQRYMLLLQIITINELWPDASFTDKKTVWQYMQADENNASDTAPDLADTLHRFNLKILADGKQRV